MAYSWRKDKASWDGRIIRETHAVRLAEVTERLTARRNRGSPGIGDGVAIVRHDLVQSHLGAGSPEATRPGQNQSARNAQQISFWQFKNG